MSYEETLRSVSLDADASLGIYTGVPGQPGSAVPSGGKQYCAVKITGAHQVGLCTAAGDNVIGIMQNKPQVPGAAATVAISGISNVMSGAAIAAGRYLLPDTGGKLVESGTGGTVKTNLISIGIASGANELIPALFV